ncbi:MAG: TetR family transcriptional regulator [Devosia sp.]|uniref:TetR/AcrR family transcriptional regulator n=1 Tax=Devosia sp. TaxID=1871048 RepID=UPI0026074468|nr:TetR/AcrR family transcriptional regulator [Devosia sp.]MDB5527623.1 TetR family transcriptional regulator [Devosia sp.]
MSQADVGRVQQKQRTRNALLLAAREMLGAGREPTLQEVADHAAISRATAYRYYSSIDTLLQEAVLDGIAVQVEGLQLAQNAQDADGLEERVDVAVAAIVDMVLANEALFRTYLKGVVAGDDRQGRGARRIRWLHDAYGSDTTRIPKALVDRLTHALALLTGIETVIVAKDVCGLDDAGTRSLVQWTARAVLTAALRDMR